MRRRSFRSMQFTWSETKAARNKARHRVAFEEAQTCFYDPFQVAFYDPDHSEREDREILIAHSNRGRLLLVSYTLRGSTVRIISARKTTRVEAEIYAQGI
jgi:uncharacterized DUF497 family protein